MNNKRETGFMGMMAEANYNFEAKQEGWIYEWTEKFITENITIMTPEIINSTETNMPPTGIFENIKETTLKSKERLTNLFEKIKKTFVNIVEEQQPIAGRSR